MSAPKLVFVYNADAGFMNGMMDSLHKTISPGTYDCALCAITHGFFSMDKSWRAYLKALPIAAEFFHRKDFVAAYPNAQAVLPAILLDRDGGLSELIGAEEMKALSDVNALSSALDNALRAIDIR
jgi:hypothetical protein